jgi:hypothetical protein
LPHKYATMNADQTSTMKPEDEVLLTIKKEAIKDL